MGRCDSETRLIPVNRALARLLTPSPPPPFSLLPGLWTVQTPKRAQALPPSVRAPSCLRAPFIGASSSNPVDRPPSPATAFNFSSPSMQNQIHELAKTLPPPRKQNTACDACRSVHRLPWYAYLWTDALL